MATPDAGSPSPPDALASRLRRCEADLEYHRALVSELIRLHLQLPALLEVVHDAVLLVDPGTERVVETNPAARALLRRSEEECHALDLATLFPASLDPMRRLLGEVLQGGARSGADLDLEPRGGGRQSVAASACRVDRGPAPLVLLALRPIDGEGARTARHETESRYRTLVENAQDLFTVIDDEGTILFMSASALRTLGSPPEECVGRSIFEFVPRKEHALIRTALRRGFSDDQPQTIVHRLRHRNGELRFFQSLGRRIQENGDGPRAVISSRDITELHRAERKLRTSAELARRHGRALVELATSDAIASGDLPRALRSISEVAASGLGVERVSIWTFDADRTVLECRSLYQDRKHLPCEPATLRTEDYPRYFEALRQGRAVDAGDARTDPRTSEFAEGYLDPHGITSTLDAGVRLSGELVGVICHEHTGPARSWRAEEVAFAAAVADQVSNALMSAERSAAERRLRDREEFLTAIVENTPDVLFVKDAADLRVRRVNRAAEEFLGRGREELLGRRLDDILPAEDAAAISAVDRAALASEHPTEILEQRVHARDGEERILRKKLIPLRAPDGERRHLLSISEDVTDRRRIESRLQQTEKMSALGELISGVAHELNNPMTGVLGFAQLLLRIPDLPARATRYLERINDEAERARRIVQNLLTFARRRKPEKRLVSVNDLLSRVLDLRDYEMRVSNVEVERHLPAGIPNLRADDDQLQQVFMNLVINAEQAMLAAHRRGRLEVRSRFDAARGVVIVTLADDGPGIPPEHLPRIFDPFFTTKPEGQGTGLGLSISFGIVEEHGGRIEVDSRPGAGTTFTVELPVLAEEPVADETARAVRGDRESVAAARILVVDDEASVVDLVREALEAEGHTVDVAYDGATALRKIATRLYDAVVTDIRMPESDGVELYLRCAETAPDLTERFLFLTGDVVAPDSLRFIEEHAVPHLAKPFEIADLAGAVRRVLGA